MNFSSTSSLRFHS